MIPVVEIIRLEENHKYGTFGVLRVNKSVFCVTLEPVDLENARNVSSIPAQQYICKRVVSPTFGKTFEILDVPGRSHVLFHSGNVLSNTAGCVLVAQHFGKLGDKRGVLNSGTTFKKFLNLLQDYDTFHLTIMERY